MEEAGVGRQEEGIVNRTVVLLQVSHYFFFFSLGGKRKTGKVLLCFIYTTIDRIVNIDVWY